MADGSFILVRGVPFWSLLKSCLCSDSRIRSLLPVCITYTLGQEPHDTVNSGSIEGGHRILKLGQVTYGCKSVEADSVVKLLEIFGNSIGSFA